MILVYASYCKSGAHFLHYPAIAFCERVAWSLNLPINDKTLRDLGVTVCADPVHIYPSLSHCVIQCTSIHLSHSVLDIYIYICTHTGRDIETAHAALGRSIVSAPKTVYVRGVSLLALRSRRRQVLVHLPPSLPIKPTWLCLWQHPHSSPRRPPARPPAA